MEDIKVLYNAKEYNAIANICESSENIIDFNEWDFKFCILSLNKLKRYNKALDIYKACIKKFPNSTLLNNDVGRALYYTYIKNFNVNKDNYDNLLKQGKFIAQKTTQNQYFNKNYILLKITEFILQKNRFYQDIEQANEYLDVIDINTLSGEEKETEIKGKMQSISSEKEKWYSLKTKALLILKKYDECIVTCNDALQNIKKLHSRNDIWFNYRKAKSLLALEKNEEAKIVINNLLKGRTPHWIIWELAFDSAVLEDNIEQAFINGAKAALADNSHKMRVSYYKKLSDFWEKHGKTIEAQKLRELVSTIRIIEGWDEGDANSVKRQRRDLLKELEFIWLEMANKGKKFINGKITKILKSGFAGFIQAEDNNSYYFNIKDCYSKNIREGQQVKFILEERFDKKKNQNSLCAVEVSIVKNITSQSKSVFVFND